MTRSTHSKRKHRHIANCQPSYVESCLVQLCRRQRWADVINRCRYYPEEACLVPIRVNDNISHRDSTKRASSRSVQGEDDNSTPLFRETALGIVCASKYIGTEEGKQVILALLRVNPNQLWASQYVSHHTPFREAILNGCCTVEIFRILAEAASTFRDGSLILEQKDTNGQKPIDHLLTSVQLGSSKDSLSMLKEFLRIKQSAKSASMLEYHASPFIRLLTTGNGLDLWASPTKARKFSRDNQRKRIDNDARRLQRVLDATRILLDDDPDLLFHRSTVTNCTPLHIAIRNYGKFAPLIQQLLDRDPTNKMVQTRNYYGDLPIHVACSVGVPFDVLGLLIEKTASVATSCNSVKDVLDVFNCEQHPLLWSCNKSGYRPVDLEWICHIESGHNLYTARQFCPSDATMEKRYCFKEDTYYRDLLKKSVDEVIQRHDTENDSRKCKSGAHRRKEKAETIFGCLLDRISLFIRASRSTTETFSDTNSDYSYKLGTPYSASLPLPMLELFLWLRPEEAMERDSHGFLPIHHALRYESSTSLISLNAIGDWKSFVFQLLKKTSEQCKMKCGDGRLPLHYALDQSPANTSSRAANADASSAVKRALQLSRHEIIEKLIDLYPGAVDQKDPVTGLYPFMMASADKSIPVNTAFVILRRSPSRCLSVANAKKN